MKTAQLRINQVTLCNGCIQTEDLNARRQILLKAYPAIDFRWTDVRNIFIAPVGILIPKNKPFIYMSFDYRFRPPREFMTTHFKELISRN